MDKVNEKSRKLGKFVADDLQRKKSADNERSPRTKKTAAKQKVQKKAMEEKVPMLEDDDMHLTLQQFIEQNQKKECVGKKSAERLTRLSIDSPTKKQRALSKIMNSSRPLVENIEKQKDIALVQNESFSDATVIDNELSILWAENPLISDEWNYTEPRDNPQANRQNDETVTNRNNVKRNIF
ncbi:hypothetical protein niasHT_032189 [Heterodera trifolii]|uniref:Uncharacterized protein n=1 Tax=Heterodera trifolii TaxID=157864 RepID=A0ABD2HQX1_9BILA